MNNPCSKRVVCYASVNGEINGPVNGFFIGYLDGNFNGTINGGFWGVINGDFNGTINGNFNGTINGDFNGTINGDFTGTINGNFNGVITGNFNGTIIGELCGGTINGDFNGTLVGTFEGTIGGVPFSGTINQAVNDEIIGEFCGTISGTFDGEIDGGTFNGDLNGSFDGDLNGTFNGSWNGTFNGQFNGRFDGDFNGTFGGNFNGQFNGDLTGFFNGNFNGFFNGSWNGMFNGTYNGIPTDPDFPFINYTTEPPEIERDPTIIFPPPGYPPGTPPDICIPSPGETCDNGGGGGGGDGGTTPPPIIVYTNTAQSCTKVCDGNAVTWTVVEGIRTGATQAAADAAAYAFACELVDIVCSGGDVPALVYNTQQTCTNDCGSSYTVPAGVMADITVEAANISAQIFACQMALVQCPVNPTTPDVDLPPGDGFPDNGGDGGGGGGGGGFGGGGGGGGFAIPPANPQPDVTYANSAQTCISACQNGGSFTSVVPSGVFFGESPAVANSIAKSTACNNAAQNKFCLSQAQVSYCKDAAMSLTMSIGGMVVPVNWQVTGLPTGLSMTDLGTDGATMRISGTPTVTGSFDATFTITDPSTGNYLVATRTFNIQEITASSALPEGEVDSPYSTYIDVEGFVATVEWIVTAGALPAGLSLNPNTGEISGTPTTEETAIFTVGVSGGDGTQCTKEFTLPIAGSSEFEWNLTWGATQGSLPGMISNRVDAPKSFANDGDYDDSAQSQNNYVAYYEGTQTWAGGAVTASIDLTQSAVSGQIGSQVNFFLDGVSFQSVTPTASSNDHIVEDINIPGPGEITVQVVIYNPIGNQSGSCSVSGILTP